MVRVGIVGFGFMGQTHWRCYGKLAEKAKVVAVADINPDRARGDIRGTWGNLGEGTSQVDFSGVASSCDWRELASNSDVDVVDVCVPTPFHAEVVTGALAAGKHVLCEKPLARSLADAQAIARAAAEAKGFFMPAMCMRFWPEWAWLKQVVADNRYGRVLGAVFTRQGTPPPGWYQDGRQSGGALLDLHIHDADFVCHLFGRPRGVSACGYQASTGEVDHVSTVYHYADVPLVVAEGGWSFAPGYPFRMRYTVNFADGATADFDLARPQPLILYHRGEATAIECEKIDGWFGEIRYFVDCVGANQKPTTVTAADAVLAMEVIEAEKQSVADQAAASL